MINKVGCVSGSCAFMRSLVICRWCDVIKITRDVASKALCKMSVRCCRHFYSYCCLQLVVNSYRDKVFLYDRPRLRAGIQQHGARVTVRSRHDSVTASHWSSIIYITSQHISVWRVYRRPSTKPTYVRHLGHIYLQAAVGVCNVESCAC